MVWCVAVRCSALQCVAVRCSALQCVAVRCSAFPYVPVRFGAFHCVAVHCSMLQCMNTRIDRTCTTGRRRRADPPAYCNVWQCVAVCCSVLQSTYCGDEWTLQHVAACCSMLQVCVAACCSRHTAVMRGLLTLPMHFQERALRFPLLSESQVQRKRSVVQCVAVCCSVLQCVAVCCNLLQPRSDTPEAAVTHFPIILSPVVGTPV